MPHRRPPRHAAAPQIQALRLTLTAFLAFALVACGGSGSSGGNEGTAATTSPAPAEADGDSRDTTPEPDASAFPVTVDTAYGEITLDAPPQRIVALSGSYVDMLAALGEQPVAFIGTPRGGDDLLAGYPWFEGIDVDLERLDLRLAESYTPSLEAILAHEPDLILGNAGENAISESMYAQISQIAPTYTSPHGFAGWAEQVTDIGALTGRAEQAAGILTDVEAAFDEAAAKLTNMQGATFVVADLRDNGASLYGTHLLFERLGLVPDTELAAAGTVSLENLDQLDSDVLNVMTFRGDSFDGGATRAEVEADPRFGDLPAAVNETVIWSNAAMVNAVSDVGPHSFAWWLDQVVPQLEASALNTQGG